MWEDWRGQVVCQKPFVLVLGQINGQLQEDFLFSNNMSFWLWSAGFEFVVYPNNKMDRVVNVKLSAV